MEYTKDMATQDAVQQRQKAFKEAEASLRFEGLALTDESRRLAARWIAGELSADAWLARLKTLYSVG